MSLKFFFSIVEFTQKLKPLDILSNPVQQPGTTIPLLTRDIVDLLRSLQSLSQESAKLAGPGRPAAEGEVKLKFC